MHNKKKSRDSPSRKIWAPYLLLMTSQLEQSVGLHDTGLPAITTIVRRTAVKKMEFMSAHLLAINLCYAMIAVSRSSYIPEEKCPDHVSLLNESFLLHDSLEILFKKNA